MGGRDSISIWRAIRLSPFRYHYWILVFVVITISFTVKVLNGTRYRQYPILTSRFQILVDGCWFWVSLRYTILVFANGKNKNGVHVNFRYRYPIFSLSSLLSLISLVSLISILDILSLALCSPHSWKHCTLFGTHNTLSSVLKKP